MKWPALCPPSPRLETRLTAVALLLTAVPTAAQSLVINELHYHPKSELLAEEFLELKNEGAAPVNLQGWRLARGVGFTFPSVTVPAGGFLVVAADTNAFRAAHPGLNVPLVGNWTGSLSDSGEAIELLDAGGLSIERISYATQGDWGERGLGPVVVGFRGLEWLSGHDGGGRTMERINPLAGGSLGQNWRSSLADAGTPGAVNSRFSAAPVPFITEVTHLPAVPRPGAGVTVTARISGGVVGANQVFLHHRLDGVAAFTEAAMRDDGLSGDGLAGDGIYGARLAAQTNGTVVEFYVRATAPGNLVRTWPAPLIDGAQTANALLQFDNAPEGILPRGRVIFTAKDRQTLTAIEAQPWYLTSDAQINATFVNTENGVADIRYGVGFRQRGATSRDVEPPSRRVALPDDRPWHGQRTLRYNAFRPHSQVAAAALAQLAGLPVARSRLAELRENGVARAGFGSPVAGLYAQNETPNGDFTATAFPGNGNGNLYRAIGYGNLDYLGEAPAAYAHPDYYFKESHAGLNDWTDLIGLTRTLNQTPTAEFATAVAGVADADEWVRFFAVNTLLANVESTLSNPRVTQTPSNTIVVSGDYYLYRGDTDPRFDLLPYDLDSCLGVEGVSAVQLPLYPFLKVPTLARFFAEPAFASRYHGELRRLMDTVFAPEPVNALLDRLLVPHIPADLVAAMKDFNVQRRNFVQAALPTTTRVTSSFPAVGGYPSTTLASVGLVGVAATPGVVAVRVSGEPATWDAAQGKWSATVPLLPGLNQLLIESLDSAGNVLTAQPYSLWREAAETTVDGTLAANTRWAATSGPFRVNGQVVVPAGVTLTIEPGTTVHFAAGAGLLVRGRLLAEGTAQRRIELMLHPRLTGRWNGVGFDGATNESRLDYVEFRTCLRAPLQFTNSVATLAHLEFPGHQANAVRSFDSSLRITGCVFPTMAFDQAIEGLGIRAGGQMVVEGNVFGSTTGYADIVDFSGGTRPGPIPQFLNNVFLGGSDDGLDLDGTDAHIEGNVFMHFHKNHSNTSSSCAIATGRGSHGEISHLTVVRNVFFDNDHDLILKEFAELTAGQNTFVNTVIGSLAFSEPLRPGGNPAVATFLRDSIWWNCRQVVFGLDESLFTNAWFKFRIDNSVFDEPGPWLGTNNLATDPLFENSTNDFRLRLASPARGLAPGGLDLGAKVPAGAVITGVPAEPTAARAVTALVQGAGLTHYRFQLDDGAWSESRPLATPLQLTALSVGAHRLRVTGLNSAGVWQPEPGTEASWVITGDFAGVRLNELLAENGGAVPVSGQTPDLVELHNPGNQPRDLGGLSLTDNPAQPRKYVFPAGTTIAPGGYLILYADSRSQPPGLHLGFAFDNDGEQALLFDRPDRGGALLDRVDFGAQLPGLSLGRGPDGEWTLGRPTFGAVNQPVPLGDPKKVRLNEWLANPGVPTGDDFVELFNPEPEPVDLTGLHLTDALGGAPRRAPVFPHTFVAARGFLSLTADGSANRPARLNLSLASDFGSLAVTDGEGGVLDAILYGSQAPAVSEGRRPDGFGAVARLASPSPDRSNGGVVPTPPTLGWRVNAAMSTLDVTFHGQVVGQHLRLESSSEPSGGWILVREFTADSGGEGVIPVPIQASRTFFRLLVVD